MNDQDQSSEEFSTSGELRSYIENNLDDENTEVYAHAGLVDNDQTLEFLNFLSSAYESDHEDLPYRFKDTKMGKMLMKSSATRTATKAVREGNISQMKFISGKQSYSTDTSGIHTLRDLREMLDQAAYIQYLFGHMGNGKTDFAILLGELGKKELNYAIGSNIKSLEEKDQYLHSYGDLLKWLADGENVDSIDEIKEKEIDTGKKLFIFDEASSHASGYSDDAYETQKKLGTLVKKIRKVGGNMIIIGHTGKDVHPDIRRITNDCVKKVSLKTAEFYKSVEEGKGRGLKFSLSHIPQTNWKSYDTTEITSWSWESVPTDEMEETAEGVKENAMTKERRNMDMAKAYIKNEHPKIESNEKGNITQEMLADYYGLSKQRVSQILSDLEERAKEQAKKNGAKA